MFPTSSYYALGWVLLCSVNKLLCLEFNDLITEQSHRCVVVVTSLFPRLLPPTPPPPPFPSSLPSLDPPPLPFSGSSSPDLPLLPLIYPSPHSPLSRPRSIHRSIQSVLHHLPWHDTTGYNSSSSASTREGKEIFWPLKFLGDDTITT